MQAKPRRMEAGPALALVRAAGGLWNNQTCSPRNHTPTSHSNHCRSLRKQPMVGVPQSGMDHIMHLNQEWCFSFMPLP